MREHDLDKHEYRWQCRICGQNWKNKPRTQCPGVQVFQYPLPEHIRTKTQLSRSGLQLTEGQQPIGVIRPSPYSSRWTPLYDLKACIPKTAATLTQERQQRRTYAQAYRQRCTCQFCKQVQKNLRGIWRGACIACREQALTLHKREARQKAITWARTQLQTHEWIVLDLETVTLHGRIIQLAIVAPDGQVLLDTLVNPGKTRKQWATHIHGLTSEDIVDAPSFADLIPTLQTITDQQTIIVYNVNYDRQIIERELRHVAPELRLNCMWECAMHQYAAFYGDWSETYQQFNFQKLPGAQHTAVEDCLAVLSLLQTMAAAESE